MRNKTTTDQTTMTISFATKNIRFKIGEYDNNKQTHINNMILITIAKMHHKNTHTHTIDGHITNRGCIIEERAKSLKLMLIAEIPIDEIRLIWQTKCCPKDVHR